MQFLPYIIGGLCAYLLGSVPFGFLIARAKGVDIRRIGSGNIGATNVYRIIGKGPGFLTLGLDFGKGLAAVVLVPTLAGALSSAAGAPPEAASLPWLRLLCGAASLVGHSFPVFLGFRGGKGVATGAGLVVGLAPWAALGAIAAWLFIFILSRYVSLASISAAVVAGALVWLLPREGGDQILPAAITLLCTLVILRHSGNIQRLVQGTENRISFKKKEK